MRHNAEQVKSLCSEITALTTCSLCLVKTDATRCALGYGYCPYLHGEVTPERRQDVLLAAVNPGVPVPRRRQKLSG